MDTGHPRNHQLNTIGKHPPNGNDAVDEPVWPKKLKNYENVVSFEINWQIIIL